MRLLGEQLCPKGHREFESRPLRSGNNTIILIMPNIKLLHIVCLLVIMTVIHFVAVSVGLYEQPIIWIDKFLHILAGIVIAMSWFWIMQRVLKTSDEKAPILLISSTIGFVLFIALFWEVFEFAYWKNAPEWANKFKFYSPTIVDVLGDMASNLLGGIVFSIFVSRKRPRINVDS